MKIILQLSLAPQLRARREIHHRFAASTIEMLVVVEHAVVAGDVAGELQFPEFAFFNEQTKIAIDGAERDAWHRTLREIVDLVGGRVLVRTRYDIENELSLPCGSSGCHLIRNNSY